MTDHPRCERLLSAATGPPDALPYAEAKDLATYGDLHLARGQMEQARDRYAGALGNPASAGGSALL